VTLKFLPTEAVIEIHRLQLSHYGGSGGIRDRKLLDSALAQPMASFSGLYLHRDVFTMAAAYLFHIVLNHPFVDGNRRVGLHAALTFPALQRASPRSSQRGSLLGDNGGCPRPVRERRGRQAFP